MEFSYQILISSIMSTSVHFSFGWYFFYQLTVDQGNGGGIMTESSVCMTPLPTVRSVFTTLYFLPITNEPETNLSSLRVRQKCEEIRYIYKIECSKNYSAPLGDSFFSRMHVSNKIFEKKIIRCVTLKV